MNITIKIGIIQNEVFEDTAKTIEHVKHLIQKNKKELKSCDFIVLSECWNAPYENESLKKAAQFDQNTLDFLKESARELNCILIGGSIPFKEGTKIYNRCFVLSPSGEILGYYDKTHLMELHLSHIDYQEKDVFEKGNSLMTLDTDKGKIGICICYDIRFPLMAKTLASQGIDILFVPAAFNESAGKSTWASLLKTRAMENQIFIVGVSPAKYSYKNYESYGHSLIANPFGNIERELDEKEQICAVEIDLSLIKKSRKRMPFSKIERVDLYNLKLE